MTTFSGDILALSAQDGSLRWQIHDEVASFSPVAIGRRLYFRTLGGHLRARSSVDGTLLWQTAPGFSSHPIRVVDGQVISMDSRNRISVLQADSGKLIRQYVASGEPIGGPTAIGDRMILFTDGRGAGNQPQPTVMQWVTTSTKESHDEKTQ